MDLEKGNQQRLRRSSPHGSNLQSLCYQQWLETNSFLGRLMQWPWNADPVPNWFIKKTATPLDLEAMRERYPIAPDAGGSMVQAARRNEMGTGIQKRFLQKSYISSTWESLALQLANYFLWISFLQRPNTCSCCFHSARVNLTAFVWFQIT